MASPERDPDGDRLPTRPSTGPLLAFGDRLAVVDRLGTLTYADLDARVRTTAEALLAAMGTGDTAGARVAVLCRPGRDVITAVFAAWRAGAMVVPLHPGHPVPAQRALVDDADVALVVTSASLADVGVDLAAPSGRRLVVLEPDGPPRVDGADPHHGIDPILPTVTSDRAALMIHTSGTTGRPKGAVHTHASLAAQLAAMVQRWDWRPDDRILAVLPLNHVHGLVNVTLCPLAVGACVEAPDDLDATATWERLASGDITVFMAVPTIYARLVTAWEAAGPTTQQRWSDGARGLRLMVSGSAALPVTVLERWRHLTGHVLLERYGMTEVGMALGNTLDHRVPGHVGVPFPGVEAMVVDDDGNPVPDGEPGELRLRGPQLFAGYWNRPDETADAFVDGWFRTGDVAVLDPDGYRLLGRASVDILKTGGEKVSALEIEETYRTHAEVADCAVVGLPDDEWGDRVVMAVVPVERGRFSPTELRAWGKERLAPAKVPTRYLAVDALPRNPMGKVTKTDVRALFD